MQTTLTLVPTSCISAPGMNWLTAEQSPADRIAGALPGPLSVTQLTGASCGHQVNTWVPELVQRVTFPSSWPEESVRHTMAHTWADQVLPRANPAPSWLQPSDETGESRSSHSKTTLSGAWWGSIFHRNACLNYNQVTFKYLTLSRLAYLSVDPVTIRSSAGLQAATST